MDEIEAKAGTDGSTPRAALIRDSSNNLYGTTYLGGASGLGVVFKLTPTGTLTVLHSFAGGATDGANPYAVLSGTQRATSTARQSLAAFFNPSLGATAGVVFKLTPTGTLTLLYSFAGYLTDGEQPYAGLIRDSSNNLYGTTYLGGTFGGGVVFKVTP